MSTFLEVVELLLTNDDAKTAYGQDPDGFLDQHGLSTFDSTDVADAMGHAADALPMTVATRLDPQQGLDSAASLDLEGEGLSLDREPVTYDEIDPSPDEVDPHDLDTGPLGGDHTDGFGEDVDFDAPAEAQAPAVNELTIEQSDFAEAQDEAEVEVIEPADGFEEPTFDAADELTEIATPALPDDSLEPHDLGLGPDDAESLEADLTTDVPDDFDLLD